MSFCQVLYYLVNFYVNFYKSYGQVLCHLVKFELRSIMVLVSMLVSKVQEQSLDLTGNTEKFAIRPRKLKLSQFVATNAIKMAICLAD